MIAAFTGHRPPKAKLTYSHAAMGDQHAIAAVQAVLRLFEPSICITGGALGFDTLVTLACRLDGVPYSVYVPCKGQENRWPKEARVRYADMLANAAAVEYVYTGHYVEGCLQRRNEAMVRASDALFAWWDGSPGGTKQCIDFAGGAANLYSPCVTWERYGGYEVSSSGDALFSPLFARMPDGRTIEEHYQCDIKGYRHWREGKGQPGGAWEPYLALWELWATYNQSALTALCERIGPNGVLSDRHATSEINQAHALAVLCNRYWATVRRLRYC